MIDHDLELATQEAEAQKISGSQLHKNVCRMTN